MLGLGLDSDAQCAMCKAQAETTHEEGNQAVATLNAGILYLFTVPYIIIGVIGYMWYRKRNTTSAL